MSADRWRTCPKCVHDSEAAHERALEKVRKQYGKIPEEEYREKIQDAEVPIAHGETLREDYHIGMDDCGAVCVEYSCSCQVCKFQFSLKKEFDSQPESP